MLDLGRTAGTMACAAAAALTERFIDLTDPLIGIKGDRFVGA